MCIIDTVRPVSSTDLELVVAVRHGSEVLGPIGMT